MLVAEIFYPNSNSEEYQSSTPPPLQDFQKYQEYLQKRAGLAANDSSSFYDQKNAAKKQKPQVCDGYDDIGCFQIRLYYDWFLVSLLKLPFKQFFRNIIPFITGSWLMQMLEARLLRQICEEATNYAGIIIPAEQKYNDKNKWRTQLSQLFSSRLFLSKYFNSNSENVGVNSVHENY